MGRRSNRVWMKRAIKGRLDKLVNWVRKNKAMKFRGIRDGRL